MGVYLGEIRRRGYVSVPAAHEAVSNWYLDLQPEGLDRPE